MLCEFLCDVKGAIFHLSLPDYVYCAASFAQLALAALT